MPCFPWLFSCVNLTLFVITRPLGFFFFFFAALFSPWMFFSFLTLGSDHPQPRWPLPHVPSLRVTVCVSNSGKKWIINSDLSSIALCSPSGLQFNTDRLWVSQLCWNESNYWSECAAKNHCSGRWRTEDGGRRRGQEKVQDQVGRGRNVLVLDSRLFRFLICSSTNV